MPTLSTPAYLRLITILLLLTYALIVVGGATRVFDAGVSCPDWPHCYGVLIPFPESHVPGGYTMNGQHFQWYQVALEWSHRTLAMLVSLGLLAATFFGIKRPRYEAKPLIAAIALLGMQVALGGLTVLKLNINWSVVLHLGTAMLFFAALAWLRRTIAAQGKRENIKIPNTPKILVYLFALTVWLTMLVGAFVSSSHAGGVCGGLFSCAGQWFPTQDLSQHSHMMHRYMALTTFTLSVILLILAKRTAPALRAAAKHLHFMVLGQVALGIATLYSFADYPDFYFPLSIAHLAWGTLVWLGAIGTVLFMHFGKHGRFHAVK
jgi:cytochrome c oxidase assembly protein subunit 15